MRIMILGGDGYLGWAQAMYLSARGHEVYVLDSLMRRHFDLKHDFDSLVPIASLHKRVKLWRELAGKKIQFSIGSTLDYDSLTLAFENFEPETVVHYGEQRTAPYSMIDREHAIFTMHNNVEGTLNVLYAIKEYVPDCHLVKLGTMGEYGTPNIDIEEGYIEIEHKGRKDILMYPKNPGSFYHLSKVHDSHNIKKCCDWWGIRATDLNQGIVYGADINDCIDERLRTRFDYDQVYGTVLNRFCVQAAVGYPLTVYGKGKQTRGYININDTMRCIELATLNAPKKGEFRVFNQFTERFAVIELAQRVQMVARSMGLDKTEIYPIPNPRIEAEEHYYNAACVHLKNLGLKPNFLTDALIRSLIELVLKYKDRINAEFIKPTVEWKETTNQLPQ